MSPASADSLRPSVSGHLSHDGGDDRWSPASFEVVVRLPRRSERAGEADRRTRRPRRAPRPRLPANAALHALVLLTIGAVVLGRGYWTAGVQLASAPPEPQAGQTRLGELPSGSAISAEAYAPYTLATTGSDIMTGYVSQFASAVAPAELNITYQSSGEGQTLADIAADTGRDINTLLWANGMTDPIAPLTPGTQVRIPPIDGMLHVVHDGDTLESIAARYQVGVEDITGYAPNAVQSSADLVPGRMLLVPGGTMPTRDRVVTYTVRDGDTLATIAQYFGLHPNTVIWANSLPDGNLIFPGQHLAILPTDGVMVQAQEGDTPESIASAYGVDAQAIRDYPMNGLGGDSRLQPGQWVMVPGGIPPAPPPPPPAPAPAAPQVAEAPPAPAAQAAPAPSAGATGAFIWPTDGVITQYFGPTSFWMEPAYNGYAHFHQGLDIANGMNTPIVAADGGVVIFAGWNTAGYGFAVSIDHGNGLVTWYGHMASQPAVWVGQQVSQGQYLGPMGSTGASTGSHVHFAVLRNGVWDDPLNYLR